MSASFLSAMNTRADDNVAVEKTTEGDADAKATELAKIVTVLGTFNKYQDMAESIGDKTVFLLLSEVFKAEYDSQVAIPMELETIRDEESKIRRVLNEKKLEEMREYNSKLDSKKERKKKVRPEHAEEHGAPAPASLLTKEADGCWSVARSTNGKRPGCRYEPRACPA
jgi:hypothetical protein